MCPPCVLPVCSFLCSLCAPCVLPVSSLCVQVLEKSYTLPDGNVVKLGRERFEAPEVVLLCVCHV